MTPRLERYLTDARRLHRAGDMAGLMVLRRLVRVVYGLDAAVWVDRKLFQGKERG